MLLLNHEQIFFMCWAWVFSVFSQIKEEKFHLPDTTWLWSLLPRHTASYWALSLSPFCNPFCIPESN